MLNKEQLMAQIKKQLIVSCQARVGWAMYGPEIMAAFAKAAEEGGAAGIRATGVDNIQSIKKRIDLPIIGINKKWTDGCNVYITPTYDSAEEILKEGIEIIALDATPRKRPNDEKIKEIVDRIRKNYPETCIMLEISTVSEAENILHLKPDFISTTLNGYTESSQQENIDNIELVKRLRKISDIPIIAEGKIESPQEAANILNAGAYAVVVGTSITRPEIITSRYVKGISEGVE